MIISRHATDLRPSGLQTLEPRLLLSGTVGQQTFEIEAPRNGVFEIFPRYRLEGNQSANAIIYANDTDPTRFSFEGTGEANNFTPRGFALELRQGVNTFTIEGVDSLSEQLSFPNQVNVNPGRRVARLARPIEVRVESLGGSSVKVDWFDRSSTELNFKLRVSRSDGLGQPRLYNQPRNTTSAILDDLVPGRSYHFEVLGSAGRGVFSAAGSADFAVPPALGNLDSFFRVTSLSLVQQGTASFTLIEGDFNVIDGVSWVNTATWQEAVWQSVEGRIVVEDGTGEQNGFVFGRDDAYTVNTAGVLAELREGSHFETMDADTRVIALEDLTGWRPNDSDFDDWYVVVEVEQL